jgi:hypothetical protein
MEFSIPMHAGISFLYIVIALRGYKCGSSWLTYSAALTTVSPVVVGCEGKEKRFTS